MRALLDSVAAERNVASSQAMSFQHELEPLKVAVRELRVQAEEAKEQVLVHWILTGIEGTSMCSSAIFVNERIK
jgi:hypothetical protein